MNKKKKKIWWNIIIREGDFNMIKVFSVFVQNLAYYNEGKLVGEWIDLPQPPEKIDKYLKEEVKVDSEHEEYEIGDVENISPFSYKSIQWANLKDLNNLAIIYSSLDEIQKEAIEAYLEYESGDYDINELINICLQVDEISYYRYYFEGIEYNQDCSPEIKMGYTMAELNGIYELLEKQGILHYFDFEKYGDSFRYDEQLLENGYLIPDYNIDLNCYSKNEIEEEVNKIIEYLNKEVEEIEI